MAVLQTVGKVEARGEDPGSETLESSEADLSSFSGALSQGAQIEARVEAVSPPAPPVLEAVVLENLAALGYVHETSSRVATTNEAGRTASRFDQPEVLELPGTEVRERGPGTASVPLQRRPPKELSRSLREGIHPEGTLESKKRYSAERDSVLASAPQEEASEVKASALRRETQRQLVEINDPEANDSARASFVASYEPNPLVDVEDDPLSTFGLEVDTGSFNMVRRYLMDGQLPPPDAVRVEEMVNAMRYPDLLAPTEGDFSLSAEWAPLPWAPGPRLYLLRLAVQGRHLTGDRPPADLILVVDTSGSMAREDRLGLVQRSMSLLLGELGAKDRVGLVTYGSEGRVLLSPTGDKVSVQRALDELRPSGSTNAEQGLRMAYDLAAETARPGTSQRIILCSDGVANVGKTGPESILERIGEASREGIELSTLGFGMGDYNDLLMEQLANQGDGRYAYVDRLEEAHRLFTEELNGTLMTLGSEARAQVEFNSDIVFRYRLVGYDNRAIEDDRFRDDTVDAGEIGVGHSVTALYELELHPSGLERLHSGGELATFRLRYRPAGYREFREESRRIRSADLVSNWRESSRSWRLAMATARFAEMLRGSFRVRGADVAALLSWTLELEDEFAGEPRVEELRQLIQRASDIGLTRPNER